MNTLDCILRLVKGTFEAQRSSGYASRFRDDMQAYQRASGTSLDPVTNSLTYASAEKLIMGALNEFMLLTGRPMVMNVDYTLTAAERTGLMAMFETSSAFFERMEENDSDMYYEFIGPLGENQRPIPLNVTSVLLLPADGAITYRSGVSQCIWVGMNTLPNQEILVMPGARIKFRISRVERVFRQRVNVNNGVAFNEEDVAVIYSSPPIANVFRRTNGGFDETLTEGRWYHSNHGLTIMTNMQYCGAIQVDYYIVAVTAPFLANGQYRCNNSPLHLNSFALVNIATFSRAEYVEKINAFLRQAIGPNADFDEIASSNDYYNSLIAKILLLGNQLRPTPPQRFF